MSLQPQGVDCVFDAVGGANIGPCIGALRRSGPWKFYGITILYRKEPNLLRDDLPKIFSLLWMRRSILSSPVRSSSGGENGSFCVRAIRPNGFAITSMWTEHTMSNEPIDSTRRSFLKTSATAAALAGSLAPQRVLGANDKVNVGWIGVGTRGSAGPWMAARRAPSLSRRSPPSATPIKATSHAPRTS